MHPNVKVNYDDVCLILMSYEYQNLKDNYALQNA